MARSGQTETAVAKAAAKQRSANPASSATTSRGAHRSKNGRGAKTAPPGESAATNRKVTDCQIINSLARGLKVLSAFGPDDAILTNKDFSVRVGLPKPTVSRLTNTLARLNFLTKDLETGGYRLGEATLALGIAASSHMDLPYVARPFLREFANKYDVGIGFGVRDRLEIRSLAYVVSELYDEAEGETGAHMALFARQALGTSASGYALMSAMSLPERALTFDQLEASHGSGPWANLRRRIEFALDDISHYGFCISMREWDRTLNSAATPIVSAGGGIPMSLACVGPSTALPESHLRNAIGPALLELKEKILAAYDEQGRF